MPSVGSTHISSTPSNVPVTSTIALSKSSVHTGILDCLNLIFVTFKPPASRSCAYCDCNPIKAFETFDISKEPITSGVVIGSALSKGWRSGPEALYDLTETGNRA